MQRKLTPPAQQQEMFVEHALKAHATQSYSIVNHAYLLNDFDALGMGTKFILQSQQTRQEGTERCGTQSFIESIQHGQ